MFSSFFGRESLKSKVKRIKRDMKGVVRSYCEEKFWIDQYGAYDIDPKFLVFWVCVQSDKVKHQLELNRDLEEKLQMLLPGNDYPSEAIGEVKIGFESQETVDRESDGNWFYHFK